MNQTPDPKSLSEMLIYELAKAVALADSDAIKGLFRRWFGGAVRKFTRMALELDRVVGEDGLSGGARWILPRFVRGHAARGVEHIPPTGPLVIAANHPGSYDSIAITAYVQRPDYKIIIGDIPFFQNLPNISQRAIFAPDENNSIGRMCTVRDCLRHLKGGGALLIFPRGGLEADPAFMPAAQVEFCLWSRSLEIFLNCVPGTSLLTAIVGGVISKSAFHHPITILRKARRDKQRLAFIYQMMRQMITGEEIFGLVPRVTFSKPVSRSPLPGILEEIAHSAYRTLKTHMEWQA